MKPLSIAAIAVFLFACGVEGDEEFGESHTSELTSSQKAPRYARIRDAARARGIARTGYLLAGIANDETGLAQCWSEATWACKGPASPDCGGGPVIAGAADGPCSAQQGGLGMFQFDAGTFSDTINRYGSDVLTVAGQTSHAIDYAVWMVKVSDYTTNAETDAKALAWIANFDLNNAALRDQWIKTVVRYYNGCQPGWSCWSARYQTYSDGLSLAVSEPGGLGFWAAGGCGAGQTMGAIDAKYQALGGCASVLGKPTTNELATPDGVGRFNHFEHGSIYWTPSLGAHEVHGSIHDKWAALDWEKGILGYPITDEVRTPDNVGRYNVFENGSIYWTQATGAHEVHGQIRDEWKATGWETGVLGYPITDEMRTSDNVGRYHVFQNGSIYWTQATGAHEVHGRIRDAWKASGAEAGSLGYPTSDEYAVTGGRRSDFQHGSITWDTATGQTSIAP